MGGLALHEGKLAEMATGEGKTLVATLPCYLNALGGEGTVLVVTANDYLARRDSETMGQARNQKREASQELQWLKQYQHRRRKCFSCTPYTLHHNHSRFPGITACVSNLRVFSLPRSACSILLVCHNPTLLVS